MPRLKLKRVAQEQLASLAPHIFEEIDRALLAIQANPEDEGVPLLGPLRGRWKRRVGGYRIIYRIRENGRLVIVDAVKKRGDAY